jgi:hypothetical protein
MNGPQPLILPLPQTSDEWLNYIFTVARGAQGEDCLIYKMDDMQYPELQSLISSGVIYPPNLEPKGYCMPKWVSDNRVFSLYNRLFTVLTIQRSIHFKENTLNGVRIRICDVDDGDEVYRFETTDSDKATEVVEYFKNKYSENPVLDCDELKQDLNNFNFKRD